jgi:hypothetical protein
MQSGWWSASHRVRAAALSIGLHTAMLLTLWIVSTDASGFRFLRNATSSSALHWQQLDGDSSQSVGSNKLFEILGAPDVVRIVVGPVNAGVPTRGLAWWSPCRGLWFAIDGVSRSSIGRTLELWLRLPGQKSLMAGVIYIHPDGSGRMISVGDVSTLMSHGGGVTLSITAGQDVLVGRLEP